MLPLRSRLLRSRLSNPIRRLSTPTSSRSSPAVAYATPPDDIPPPPPQSNANLFTPSKMVVLPRMLPGDSPLHIEQANIYPTTGIIDSISMISICLRRPEHIPRGFSIFRQILQDASTGSRAMPEAEVFGRVIEGVASLGREGAGNWKIWRERAKMLVGRWEGALGVGEGYPAVARQGIKVYQGWFSGMISSETPLDDLVPYFARGLPLQDLLSSVKISDLPLAFEALTKMAESHKLDHLAKEVRELQGWEREQRTRTAREVVPEVQPVLAESKRGSLTRKQIMSGMSEKPTAGESEIRFSVLNLRRALGPIDSSALPINRQRELETAALEAAQAEMSQAAERMKEEGRNPTLSKDQLQSWMHGWLGELTTKLENELAAMRARVDRHYDGEPTPVTSSASRTIDGGSSKSTIKENVLLLYLTTLPAEKVALITILEVMRAIGTSGISDGMKAVRGMLSIGKGLETEYLAETIKNVAGVDSSQWLRTIDPQTQQPSERLVVNTWKNIGRGIQEEGVDSRVSQEWGSVWTPSWSGQAHIDVGGFLLALLLETAKVTRTGTHPITGQAVSEEQPAFAHSYEYVKGRKLGVFKVNPTIAQRMTSDSLASVIHPKHLPMLVEPKPWTAYNSGGYLIHHVPIMRVKDSPEQKSYLKSASEQGHLEPIFHGVDVLSSTSWTINRGVFQVVLEAWNAGEEIADVPASEAKAVYDYPTKLDAEEDSEPLARIRYYEAVKRVLSKQRKHHAERCKFNYTLEVARSFLNETFYLPHNMDFRGRTYPIPPYLSPVGDDLNRGLLLFGEKKALGETGLKWLRIHLANVFGYDKMSFEERARFAVDHEKDIFDSADNPLNGERWWLKAEDPWQCLATCMELRNALRSDDPTAYESPMPVHQDGTCNGMQHYAALGGDVRGARAVNLENGDRPADIYTRVVDIVNKVIEDDAKEGLAVAQLIKEPLGRKIVKQTVMTTVYGVTFIGARDQIGKQLLAKGTFDAKDIFPISTYIARTVLSCIGDLFSGAKDIMEWLTTSARLVSRSIPPDRLEAAVQVPHVSSSTKKNVAKNRIGKELMTSVIWTTPLGLPVVQPYRKPIRKQVMTTLQSVYVSDPNAPSEVAPMKQASAFPPNFIHSLDATHMLLTALKCRQNGLAFAAVHDSYWTHAATVEPMSEHIRATFIQLHSQDIIGQLREEFIERYGEYRLPVLSAKRIHSSAVKRKVKEDERRARVRAVLGDKIDSSLDATTAEPSTSSSLLGQEPSILAMASAEEEIMGPATDEEDSDPVESSEGLGEDELELIAKALEAQDGDLEIKEERIGSHKFVKFSDILPPTPPRGVFDVSRVGDSVYFFS